MIQSSSCPQWQLDRPGPAGDHDGLAVVTPITGTRSQFGNLGLAAAAYNTGPGRASAWLTNHRPLPGETRNYVALVTGWTADEWASSSPPEKADTTIPKACLALGLPI